MPRPPRTPRLAARVSCVLAALVLLAACGDTPESTAPAAPNDTHLAARGGGPHLIATTVVAGLAHACALEPRGAAWCWGANGLGQLGDGGTTASQAPVAVAGGLTFTSLDASQNHTCGLTRAGEAYCWGQNAFGQLGDGSTTDRATPVRAAAGHTFKQISVGTYATCGLDGSGRALCWGANRFAGMSGNALGAETTASCANPNPSYRGATWPCSATPLEVAGGHTFTAISAGLQGACALTDSGVPYCWGWNQFGQLGTGAISGDAKVPAAVAGGHTFVSIGFGAIHGCGVTASGDGWCWGAVPAFNFGQLGDGTSGHGTGSATPVRVAGGLAFASIAPARVNNIHAFTCGVTVDGTGYCWGANRFGGLGAPSAEICVNGVPCATTPLVVSGGHTFETISTGSEFACGVTRQRSVVCWGQNESGQLGNGNTENSSTPVLVSAAPRGRGR